MKKILPALLLVLVLLAGAAGVYYVQKQVRGSAASLAVAGYLPPDTLLLVAVPDTAQTAEHWKTTDLYKIWAEPEVQAFLAMPLSKIPPDNTRDNLLAQAAALQPKNLFIALTAIDDQSNQPHFIAGFQFKGPSSNVDRLIAPAKDSLRQKSPAGRADLINYQGHSLETFATGYGLTVGSVYLGDWYLFANDLELLKATIDRFDHRTPATAPALEKDGDFQAVSARLPAGYETLIFAHVQPFWSRMLALAAASGQPISAEARQQADKGRAFGAATKIENGKLRDSIYYLAPGLSKDIAPLSLTSLALTSPDTLLYLASVFHLPDRIDLPDTGGDSPVPNPAMILKAIAQQLQAKGITPGAVHAAFGPGSEAALQLDWPADRAQPAVIASVGVKDPVAAGKLLDALTSTPLVEAGWQIEQAGPLTLHVLTLPGIDAFHPTLAVTGKNLILGLNVSGVKDAAAREQANAPNFSQSEAYKTAVAEVEKPNLAFSYLDTRALFERVYGVVKPAAILGAAFLYPQVNNYVDLGKLPALQAISKHLSPTVMSATLDSQGELIESVGSITLFQAATVLTGGSGAVAAPFLQSRLGGLLPGIGAPAAVPGATAAPPGP